MGCVIKMTDDRHEQVGLLLPWYVTGQLSEPDRDIVAAHLSGCPQCRAAVKLEHRLDAKIQALPLDTEQSWSRFQERLVTSAAHSQATRRDSGILNHFFARPFAMSGFFALQTILLSGFVLAGWQTARPADFKVLGSPASAAAGNIIVIFRPDVTELQFRQTLRASRARLIDGPTPANGYVLHVAPGARDSALVRLRANGDVTLAEPLDEGPAR